jgi:hypothetical protein
MHYEKVSSEVQAYRSRIEEAKGFSEVWGIVKDSVRDSLGERRGGMLLFLDDLPLQLGAYHPLGTNNMVLNRTLLQIVETATKSKIHINALVYGLLLHEYLHALGHVNEGEVRTLVYGVARECFGDNHIVTKLAKESPGILLKNISLNDFKINRNGLEIVKDFEKHNRRYLI